MNHEKFGVIQLYGPESYNRYLTLKVPVLLIIVMIYAVRHILVVVLVYNPKFLSAFLFMRGLFEPWYVVADLPALMVMAAWWQRRPNRKILWKRVWGIGRVLLTLSLALQLIMISIAGGMELIGVYYLDEGERIVIASMVLNLLAIYYIWRSTRVRDTFTEFPVG